MDSLTNAQAAVVGGIVAGTVGFILLYAFVRCVIMIIARWRLFNKAGEAGWKSLIPIYNEYVSYRIAWNTQNFWIWFALGFAGTLFASLSGGFATDSAGNMTYVGGGNQVFIVLMALAMIAAIVWGIRFTIKFARAYGRGLGFAIGLIFLPSIFYLVLAFGSASYVGPQE